MTRKSDYNPVYQWCLISNPPERWSERTFAWSPEAEEALLGAIIRFGNEALRAIGSITTPREFKSGMHRRLFKSFKDLNLDGPQMWSAAVWLTGGGAKGRLVTWRLVNTWDALMWHWIYDNYWTDRCISGTPSASEPWATNRNQVIKDLARFIHTLYKTRRKYQELKKAAAVIARHSPWTQNNPV